MIRRPPRSTRTDTLFPYPTLFRSVEIRIARPLCHSRGKRQQGFPAHASLNVRRRVPNKVVHLRQGRRTPDGRRDRKEHTSELQSLMRISYAVFCLKNKKTDNTK